MTTYIESSIYYCKWKIENTCSSKEFLSPTFESKSKVHVDWKMRLYCNRDSSSDALAFEGFTRRKGLSTVIKISVLNSLGDEAISIREDFGEGQPGYIYMKNDIRRENTCITIDCKIYTLEKKEVELQKMLSLGECVLVEDIAKFYLSSEHSDVVIRAENEEFPAHRFVLQSRSPVFSAMFQHNTKEKNIGVIEIKDLSAEVVKMMLHFMYTGQPPKFKDLSLARELLVAAEKYAIKTLKQLCENFLVMKTTAQSVFDMLITAHVHNCAILKEFCLHLISSNIRYVVKDKILSKIADEHPELLKDVFKAINEEVI